MEYKVSKIRNNHICAACKSCCFLNSAGQSQSVRLQQDFQRALIMCSEINVGDHEVRWQFLNKLNLVPLDAVWWQLFLCPVCVHAERVKGNMHLSADGSEIH